MLIENELNLFIRSEENNGALLITGEWGCGKSYLIKKYDNILLSSLVPVIGFTLSTLSLNSFLSVIAPNKIFIIRIILSSYISQTSSISSSSHNTSSK